MINSYLGMAFGRPADQTAQRTSALQLKREWSPWPEFGWFPPNLREFSKG
jgi:hypothetical protein